ncbi:MAG: hypothetical protein NC548_38190 [Lachnospiraceae bacterium]|nr:hypothetical protein [Lachnospiraceae bacterium]
MAKFYPELHNLFDNLRPRKAKYTPEQIVEEFKAYVKDLEDNPIELDTEYRRQNNEGGRASQKRLERIPRPPKVLDFVVRWLGMTHQWWYALPKLKRGDDYKLVVEKITQYCSDVKFDGAVVGVYNANIIARDLGLHDNINYRHDKEDDDMTREDMLKELARLEALRKKD